jgi:hypothetical protein
MKKGNRIVSASLAMVMVLGLFLGAFAGTATAVATPTPVVNILSPANNTHTNHGYMNVNWNVTGVLDDVWNWTRTYNVGQAPSAWVNVSSAHSRNLTLANGTWRTDVMAVHWNGTGYQNSTMKSVFYVLEQTAPTITDFQPTGAAVPLTTHIVVTFSEEMNKATVSVAVSPQPPAFGDAVWTNGNKTVTYYIELAPSTACTATVSGKDLAGNAVTGTLVYQFSSLTWAYGFVVDSNSKALSNATVTLQGPPGATLITTTTDASGKIGVLVPTNTYTITFSLSGYDTVTKSGVQLGPGQAANNLGSVTLSKTMDWTIPIVIIVIGIIVIIVIVVALMRRK